jgi:hypothetical protein
LRGNLRVGIDLRRMHGRVRWQLQHLRAGPQSTAPLVTFSQAPDDPGQGDCPSPVRTWAIRTTPSPPVRSASADAEHAPHREGWRRPSFRFRRSVPPGLRPEPLRELPSAQGPFARRARYLRRREVVPPFGQRYPVVRATTNPCASPPPSRRPQLGSAGLGRPGHIHQAELGSLPSPSTGIATCLKRATGTAGLAPAGFPPCRLLRSPGSSLAEPICNHLAAPELLTEHPRERLEIDRLGEQTG